MKSLLKIGKEAAPLPLIDEVKLGIAPAELELADIALLGWPNQPDHQKRAIYAMIELCQLGMLPYQRCNLVNEDTEWLPPESYTPGSFQHAIAKLDHSTRHMNEVFDKLSSLSCLKMLSGTPEIIDEPPERHMFWVHAEQMKAYFIENDEWPIDSNTLLYQWISDTIEHAIAPFKFMRRRAAGQKITQRRHSDIHELLEHTVELLTQEFGRFPQAREVLSAWRKNPERLKADEIIQEISGDEIYWHSMDGNESVMRFKTLRNRLSLIKQQSQAAAKKIPG